MRRSWVGVQVGGREVQEGWVGDTTVGCEQRGGGSGGGGDGRTFGTGGAGVGDVEVVVVGFGRGLREEC